VSPHRADAHRRMVEARQHWIALLRERVALERMLPVDRPGDAWVYANVVRPREAEAKRLYRDAVAAVCAAGRAA
jgi:hypothetical protein